MTRVVSLATGSLCLLLAGGVAPAATRVALVVGAGGPEVRSVIDLATARVSTAPGIELLERAAIDRVLAEQKLTLAGLADAGQAITAGKLLSADVLAVVEISADRKQPLGLVVFDARTGLRLWDAALPAGGPEKGADEIAEALKAALKKHAAGLAGLRTVGFVAVRNADLPRPMDSFCESLGLLVERRLAASPAVGVLERQRLEAVTGERALPTGTAEKELLGALVQLDLEVRRGQGEGLQATVLLTDGKGKQVGKVTVPLKRSELTAGADALAAGICEALKTAKAEGKPDAGREGTRFLTEARQLWSFKQLPRALRAAESAYALDPNDPAKRILLAQYLMTSGGNELSLDRRPFRPIQARPEAVVRGAGLMRRGLELRALALSSLPEKKAHALSVHINEHIEIDGEWSNCLYKVSLLETRLLDAESKRHLADLQEAAQQWIGGELLEIMAGAAEREPVFFEFYTSTLEFRVHQLRLAAPDAQSYTRRLIGIMQRWLEVAGKLGPTRVGEVALILPWRMLTQTSEQARRPIRWSPGPRELELFEGLFAAMEKQSHLLLRFQGRCGHLWVARLNRKISPEDCYRAYLQARREVLKEIQDPRRPARPSTVFGYCLLVNQLCTWDALGFRAAGKRSVEQYELWEGMLSRKVLLHEVLAEAPFAEPDLPGGAARKLALLDRTLELIENPRVPYHRGDRQVMKNSLTVARSRHLAAHPELAAKKEVPWERVETLLDVADLAGIRALGIPTVVGNDVFVIGLGGEPRKEFLQPFRVPLAGGAARPLGQAPVAWPSPLPDPPVVGIPDTVTGCQVGPRHVYVSTLSEGLYAFPLDGGPGRRLDQGKQLPSQGATALAVHDGRLYAGLVGGYLVSLDPQSEKFEVMASSRRREKASPFDDGEAFAVTYLAADPARRRILFVLHQGTTRPGAPSGLWSWDLKTREFKRLLETGGSEWPLSGNPIDADRLLLTSSNHAIAVDLTRDKYVHLWGWGDPHGPLLSPKTALCQEFFQAHPPHVYYDGWLWAAAPFGRISIKDSKQELLPPPQRKGTLPSGGTEAFLPVGKDRLLLATRSALWLITLRTR